MRKLGRKKSNREHLIRNLATSLVLYETIDTTEAKAKEVKQYLETVLARNKENNLNTIRNVETKFFDSNAAKKLIGELIPRYSEKKSGFIKSYRLANRKGDNSAMLRLELVDKKVFVDKKPAKSAVKEDVKAEKEVKENE